MKACSFGLFRDWLLIRGKGGYQNNGRGRGNKSSYTHTKKRGRESFTHVEGWDIMISNSFYAGHVNLSNAEAGSYPIKGETQNISPSPRGLRGGGGGDTTVSNR